MLLTHNYICMDEGLKYHIRGSFLEGERFHKLIAICENFTLKMFTESISSVRSLSDS